MPGNTGSIDTAPRATGRVVLIMCPDGAGPGVVADKIRVEGADGKVVDVFIRAGVVQLSNRHSPTIVADDHDGPARLKFSLPQLLNSATS